jgi:hypothetical protein
MKAAGAAKTPLDDPSGEIAEAPAKEAQGSGRKRKALA